MMHKIPNKAKMIAEATLTGDYLSSPYFNHPTFVTYMVAGCIFPENI